MTPEILPPAQPVVIGKRSTPALRMRVSRLSTFEARCFLCNTLVLLSVIPSKKRVDDGALVADDICWTEAKATGLVRVDSMRRVN